MTTRLRCEPVQQFETRLTGVVLAAAQGDRLRLHHRPRIRQLRTENEPAHSLSKLTISEITVRFNDLNILYHPYQFLSHSWNFFTTLKNEESSPARSRLVARASRSFDITTQVFRSCTILAVSDVSLTVSYYVVLFICQERSLSHACSTQLKLKLLRIISFEHSRRHK